MISPVEVLLFDEEEVGKGEDPLGLGEIGKFSLLLLSILNKPL